MTDEGEPYGPARYKEIAQECYLISKHTHTSYEDSKQITPVERSYILEFITEDLQRQQEMYRKAQEDAQMRAAEKRGMKSRGRF